MVTGMALFCGGLTSLSPSCVEGRPRRVVLCTTRVNKTDSVLHGELNPGLAAAADLQDWDWELCRNISGVFCIQMNSWDPSISELLGKPEAEPG